MVYTYAFFGDVWTEYLKSSGKIKLVSYCRIRAELPICMGLLNLIHVLFIEYFWHR